MILVKFLRNQNRALYNNNNKRFSEFHLQTDSYDCSIRQKHRTEGNRKEKQVQSPRTTNTENVAYKNRNDPCGRRCTWYSKEGDDKKHQESIRESYCDRDSKDLHAGICANPQKGA